MHGLAYPRGPLHDFFPPFFPVSKKGAHGLPNGSPGDPQIHQKHDIASSGRGPDDPKLEAPDPRKLCFYIGGVTKITLSAQLQKAHHMLPKMSSKWCHKQSNPGPEASSKTQQKQTPKTPHFGLNIEGGGIHERSYRIPNCPF